MDGENIRLGTVDLGLEVPSRYLSWFEPFQEFFVCLAQEVLSNTLYAAWHLRQSIGKNDLIILDNGTNEYGSPMGQEDLYKAAISCGAALVIAPDYLGDRDKTISAFKEFIKTIGSDNRPFNVVGVCQGSDVNDMQKCFVELRDLGADLISFPYKLPRLKVIRELADNHLLESKLEYGLLGFNSFDELNKLVELGEWRWMLDTGEPIKAAIKNILVSDGYKPIKGEYPIGPEIELTDEQLFLATVNVARFSSLLPLSKDDENDDENDID